MHYVLRCIAPGEILAVSRATSPSIRHFTDYYADFVIMRDPCGVLYSLFVVPVNSYFSPSAANLIRIFV